MPIVQFYANAPAEIYEIAKNTNPMLKKMIDAARVVVNCKVRRREVQP